MKVNKCKKLTLSVSKSIVDFVCLPACLLFTVSYVAKIIIIIIIYSFNLTNDCNFTLDRFMNF